MEKDLLRVWNSFDINEVKKHLLVIGDSLGSCESCKELGLDYATVKACPSCGTPFKYVCLRHTAGAAEGRFHVVKRLLSQRTDLTVVDYDDFKKIQGRDAAHKFFSD